MKTLSRLSFVYFLWGAALVICSCGPIARSANEVPPEEPPENIIADTEATFTVEGMTCTSCEMAITARLKKHPGVTQVIKAIHGSVNDNVIVIFSSQKTNTNSLRQLIEKKGKFRVKNVVSKPI